MLEQSPLYAPAESTRAVLKQPQDNNHQAEDAMETVLLVLRCALPFLLATSLLLDGMFAMLARIGDYTSNWAAIDEDEDDILMASVKAKRARKRRRQLAEQKPETRPRKWLLLFPLVALSLASCVDGLALIIVSVLFTKSSLSNEEIWPILVAIACYTFYAIRCHLASSNDAGTSMLLKYACGLSVSSNLALLICLSALSTIAHNKGVLQIVDVANVSFKVLASVCLACAYFPRFREAVPSGIDLSELETRASTCVNSETENTSILNKTAGRQECEDDDDDDDDDKPKKKTPYDWPSMLLRMKRLMPLIFPRHSRLSYVLVVVCVGLQALVNAARVLQPRQFGFVVNDLAAGRAPWKNLLIWAGLRGMMNSSGLISVLRRGLWRPISNHIGRNMDNLTFSHVLNLGLRYHGTKKTGEVISVLSRGDSVNDVLDQVLFFIIPMYVNMVGSVIVLASTFGPGIICVVTVTGLAYICVLIATKNQDAALRAEYVDRRDIQAALKNESISNVELLKYFCMEPYEVTRYSKSLLRTQKAAWDWNIYLYTVGLLEEAVQVSGVVAGALLIANQIITEHLETGLFVMFLTYINSILGNLDDIQWSTQWLNSLFTNTDKLMNILEEKNEIVDNADAEELLECQGHIEFKNVTLIYDEVKGKKTAKEPRKALDDVSFVVKPGEHVALVGETGAGKSTIFKLLYRFFEPQEGCIKVEGRNIQEYTQRSLRQALGVVQQEGQVFNDTIFANIKYGDITAPDEKVMEAAKMAQIHDKISEWPKGYQTVVGERGVKLSGGEKQRVNIARTILKNSKILLLDEATSALDSNTEKAIQGQLRQLTRGKTTIAIAHRLSTIAHADKIIVLDKGKIVESGTHEELLRIEGGFYRKLWETQSSSGKPALGEDSSIERQNEILDVPANAE